MLSGLAAPGTALSSGETEEAAMLDLLKEGFSLP